MSETFEGLAVIDDPLEALEHKRRKIDHRGLLFCWKKPDPHATYYMGIDPTRGVSGWSRTMRTMADAKVDNGAIEVLRLGRRGLPDEQVAEFAAPIDPQDLATVATKVGRMYSGTSERGCLAIVETTGVGVTTQEDMLRKYKYFNMYVWKKLGGMEVHRTTTFGWQATPDSNLALFLKGTRHIEKNRVIINSPWLVDEMADAVSDWNTMRTKSKWGSHDDLLRAFLLSVWSAHDWEYADDDAHDAVHTDEKPLNLAASDLSTEEMDDYLAEEFENTMMREERS